MTKNTRWGVNGSLGSLIIWPYLKVFWDRCMNTMSVRRIIRFICVTSIISIIVTLSLGLLFGMKEQATLCRLGGWSFFETWVIEVGVYTIASHQQEFVCLCGWHCGISKLWLLQWICMALFHLADLEKLGPELLLIAFSTRVAVLEGFLDRYCLMIVEPCLVRPIWGCLRCPSNAVGVEHFLVNLVRWTIDDFAFV